jgi:acetyl esterase/lipase
MRSKWILLAVLLFLASRSVLLSAQAAPTPVGENPPVEENFTVTSDVTYTNGAQGPLRADVYIPSGTGVHPGIVFIHGGGWVSGNRSQMMKVIKALADAGYVGFTIDYDLGKSSFPGALNESLAAVKFFRAHAAEYHLDPFRIAVAGSSAGGELAALVGLAKGDPASQVEAAVIFNGALDLTAAAPLSPSADGKAPPPSDITIYLGGECAALMDACRAASPQFQIHAGAPPFFVGHGDLDQSVPFAEAVAFTKTLEAANVPVVFFQANGGKHTYWADPRFYAPNLEAVKTFLAQHLK